MATVRCGVIRVRDVIALVVRWRRRNDEFRTAGAGCQVGVGVELGDSLWITK